MAKKHNATGRSTGKLAPFAALERYVMDSPAYLDLTLSARAALFEFLYAYTGTNNGEIIMGARQLARRLRVSHGSAAIYIRELEDHGFIEHTRMGGFTRRSRLASEFSLTMYPCGKTGRKGSKAFMAWEASLSNQLDQSVKPIRQSQQNCSRRSKQQDRKAKKAPAIGLTSHTHLDITIGTGIAENVVPFRKGPEGAEFPDLPAFLDRRSANVG